MDCCEHCLDASQLPEYCPVALNICGDVLFNGPRRSGDRRLHDGTSSVLRQPPDPSTGNQKKKRGRPSTKGHPSTSNEPDHKVSDTAGTAARKSTASSSTGRSVHSFFTSRPKQCLDNPPAGVNQVERTSREEDSASPSQTTPFPSVDPRDGDQIGSPATYESSGQGLGATGGPGSGDERRSMELHDLRPLHSEDDSHHQDSYHDGEDEGECPGIERTGEGSQSDITFQMLETDGSQCRETNLPLAVADLAPPPTPMGVAEYVGSLEHLAPSPSPSPSPSEPFESPGRDLGPQSSIFREEAGRACLSMNLSNNGVLCFVNATVSAFIWATLQRAEITWGDFGRSAPAVQELLTPVAGSRTALEPNGFAGLMSRWGTFEHQSDAHEFLSVFLAWADPDHLNAAWQRRIEVEGHTRICDQGSKDMPPTLSPPDAEKASFQLQMLIDSWHEYRGMRTCFEIDAPTLGVHLDRYIPFDRGATRATWTLDLPYSVLLPFWQDAESLLIYHREYVVVAAVLHAGLDNQGHCEAGLMSPQGWFLTDDHRGATILDPTLKHNRSEIVYLWLVRADLYSFAGISNPQQGKDDLVTHICQRIHQGQAMTLLNDDRALRLLRTSCGACGCLFFGSAMLEEHVKTVHPGYWLELRRTYQEMGPQMKCYYVPCAWCCTALDTPASFYDQPEHYCAVALNAAVCRLFHRYELQEMSSKYSLDRDHHCPGPSL